MAEPKNPKLAVLKGGLNIAKRLLDDGEETLTAAQRAEAGRKAAELIKSQPQVKASEALGQLMEKGFKRTTTTQADRTRVGGGNIGGAPFSALSEADPNYAGKVWGVMDEGTASRLKNLTAPDTAWTTMLGSADQLKTNPIVFDKLKRQFIDAMKQGKLSPELEAKINHNLALNFGEGAQIRDPQIWKQADTFEKRAALADLMMGQGIPPKKGGVALGGEKSGKGVIFKPTDTLKRETEPTLLHTEHGGDTPTFAAGPRLFTLENESVYRPDLHPGFPTLLTGKDLEVNMIPTPTEVYLPDWHKDFKKKKPERFQGPWAQDIIERRKNKEYKLKGAEGPGYYDLALGLKGEGLPSQDLNDEYIRHLLREGFKDGGEVDIKAADARLAKAIENRMAKGGVVDLEAADARLSDAIAKRMGMADGGEVGFKKIQFMADGGKIVKGLGKIAKRMMADDVMPAAEREANLAKFLEPSKTPMRLYHGTMATEGGKRNEAIRRLKPSKEGALGSGVYMTPKPAYASNYALDHMTPEVYASSMGDAFEAGNVLPVHAQIRNPLILGNTGERIDPAAEALMKLGIDKEKAQMMVERLYEDKGNIGKQIQARAQAQGYDGLMLYHTDGTLGEVVSYNPSAVKSAIGNEGTYDIHQLDLSKAHGGLAMAKGGVLHMADAGKVVRGMAQVGKRLLQDLPVAPKVRPPSDNVANVRQANFQYPKTVGNQTVGIDKLSGGVRMSDPNEVKRVKALADQIASPEGYISRIIVDHNNNVIEGQHRLEALRQLGVKDVPVFKIEDLADTMPVSKMEEAMREVGGIRSDHVNQLMQHALDAISEGGIEGARQLNYGGFQKHYDAALNAITSDVKKADGGSVFKKLTFMAQGGGAFKKISFYDKGGITTSGGTFSAEELGVNPSDLVADEKLSKKLKRGIAREMDIGKEQLEQEYRQLGNKGGKKDAAIRIGSQFLGSGSDLLNLGLEGLDLIQGAIPALSKPESVLDVTGDRVPKFKLASDKPFLGSQQFIDKFKEAKLLGENEFPLTELMAGFVAPAAAVGAFRKGKQAYKGAKALVDTPKKRQGGLTAMAR